MKKKFLVDRVKGELNLVCRACSGRDNTCLSCVGTGLSCFVGAVIGFYDPKRRDCSNDAFYFIRGTLRLTVSGVEHLQAIYLHRDGVWRTKTEHYGLRLGGYETREDAEKFWQSFQQDPRPTDPSHEYGPISWLKTFSRDPIKTRTRVSFSFIL